MVEHEWHGRSRVRMAVRGGNCWEIFCLIVLKVVFNANTKIINNKKILKLNSATRKRFFQYMEFRAHKFGKSISIIFEVIFKGYDLIGKLVKEHYIQFS